MASRLEKHVNDITGLLGRQYRFPKERSKEDAFRKFESIGIPSGNAQRFSVAVSLNVKNAFNRAGWKRFISSLDGIQVPSYLKRMIYSYLENRPIQCESPSRRI